MYIPKVTCMFGGVDVFHDVVGQFFQGPGNLVRVHGILKSESDYSWVVALLVSSSRTMIQNICQNQHKNG